MAIQYHNDKALELAIERAVAKSLDGVLGVNSGTPISSADLTLYRQSILVDPKLAPPIGATYRLTDGILQDKIVTWLGDGFRPLANVLAAKRDSLTNALFTITSVNSAADATSVLAEEVTIPGFIMGPASVITIRPQWTFTLGTSVSKATVEVNQGATTVNLGSPTVSSTAGAYAIRFKNIGLQAQRTLNTVAGVNFAANELSSTIDTTQSFKIQFKMFWSAAQTAGNTITLNSYDLIVE
jgi:hypothetical protein